MSSSTSPASPDAPDASCSSSVDTLRGLPPELTISISAIAAAAQALESSDSQDSWGESQTSRPVSPHGSSNSWPPSPSSPSGDSVSSFPSVSSSFLFSSNPVTPPHVDVDLELLASHLHHQDPHALVIPSLVLPSPLRKPTTWGKSVGDVKVLVLSEAGSRREAEYVLRVLADEECEDYVDVGRWEKLAADSAEGSATENPDVLRISTDWLEHRDAHGLERYEATKNIELVHLPEYTPGQSVTEVVRTALRLIHTPFHLLHDILKTDYPPNHLLHSLLSSSTTPLYTALVLVLDNAPSPYEESLIKELSPHIPLVVLSSHSRPDSFASSSSRHRRHSHISSIHPRSPLDFRTALLRSPDTLTTLRQEAADRFLRWREVERSVELALNPEKLLTSSASSDKAVQEWKRQLDASDTTCVGSARWDKAKWESEWEGSLSSDVSRALRQRRNERKTVTHSERKLLERRLTVTAKTRPPLSAIPLTPFPASSPSPLPLSERSVSPSHGRRSYAHRGSFYARERHPSDFPSVSFDPLHFPSLFAFSCSLLAPLRSRLAGFFSGTFAALAPQKGQGLSLGFIISAFCAGLGFGFVIAKFRA